MPRNMPSASSLRPLRPSQQVLPNPLYSSSLRRWKDAVTPRLLRNYCCLLATSARPSSSYRRSDFTGQPYTGTIETNAPTRGPLSTSATNGVPRLLPRDLKRQLDKYVIGQQRAKVILSTVFFYHYQGVLRRKRIQDEEKKRLARLEREEAFERDPIDGVGEFAERESPEGFSPSRSLRFDRHHERRPSPPHAADEGARQVNIQKSNVLMLGPTGVGKTLIVETLVREIDVPFAMCDCTSLTQAGYIGEDVESSVHKLLIAADYDPARAENGIIIFDEVDKIATARVPNGKDVSGEGVQQALLKLIEGTTLQINVKQSKSSARSPPGGGSSPNSGSPFPKEETYTIKTDNILFIFAGAFVGLDKIVRNRISKSSIGFGSPISFSNNKTTPSKTEAALIRKNLPYFSLPDENLTMLDIVDPEDLRQFGFIPEFIGRIPKITALTHLSVDDLMRILTDTEDCKVAQYAQLFQESSGVELRFTTPALQVIAQRALDKGTGARGLVSVLENLLGQTMYEAPTPGKGIRYVLVDEKAADLKDKPIYYGKSQYTQFHEAFRVENEEWEAQKAREKGEAEVDAVVVPEVLQQHEVLKQQAGKAGM